MPLMKIQNIQGLAKSIALSELYDEISENNRLRLDTWPFKFVLVLAGPFSLSNFSVQSVISFSDLKLSFLVI